ncbi:MAG: sigma-70 family RNA polymerase sigma factor [Spirochaetes bacterium]|jgi:RNA polymerase sigma factor (sigma-70 family)|nr:sigma-70 family RNA polymerase sigma factor [Spirochaetota bacterium]
MYNPFAEKDGRGASDADYIAGALKGDPEALEGLVLRHQAWIFNIAVNMTNDVEASQDITQEVLIKVITNLSSYDPGKAAFRTWLYRIAANHILDMKRSRKERTMSDLYRVKNFNEYMASIPDTRKSSRPGYPVIAEETKKACLQCVLLCLGRRDRLVFVLGAMFGAGDGTGSEICGISRVNYRKILSRSRQRVRDFFMKNCGLVSDDNPCRCGERTAPLAALDMISEPGVKAMRESGQTIGDTIGRSVEELEDSYHEFTALFRSQPFYRGPDMTAWLRDLLGRSDIRALLGTE